MSDLLLILPWIAVAVALCFVGRREATALRQALEEANERAERYEAQLADVTERLLDSSRLITRAEANKAKSALTAQSVGKAIQEQRNALERDWLKPDLGLDVEETEPDDPNAPENELTVGIKPGAPPNQVSQALQRAEDGNAALLAESG